MTEALFKHARLILATIGFLGVFLAPPYVPLICIVLLALRFRSVEAMGIGLLCDLVWLPGALPHALPLFTIFAVAVVWALEPLRTQLLR